MNSFFQSLYPYSCLSKCKIVLKESAQYQHIILLQCYSSFLPFYFLPAGSGDCGHFVVKIMIHGRDSVSSSAILSLISAGLYQPVCNRLFKNSICGLLVDEAQPCGDTVHRLGLRTER